MHYSHGEAKKETNGKGEKGVIMIDVKELRLGNYVRMESFRYIPYGCIDVPHPGGSNAIMDIKEGTYIVTGIANTYVFISGLPFDDFEKIHPIPLTEEVLLMCGFKKTPNRNYVLKLSVIENEIIFMYHIGSKMFFIHTFQMGIDGKYKETKINLKNINQLHQLQNIFFALTGEEMEI